MSVSSLPPRVAAGANADLSNPCAEEIERTRRTGRSPEEPPGIAVEAAPEHGRLTATAFGSRVTELSRGAWTRHVTGAAQRHPVVAAVGLEPTT